jgi:hypothetical protein
LGGAADVTRDEVTVPPQRCVEAYQPPQPELRRLLNPSVSYDRFRE